MRELVFMLEEESARALLATLLPRLTGDATIASRFVVFEGKQDLDRQIGAKLRGYLNPRARFIVLRDQDRSDCRKVKKDLLTRCRRAGRTAVVRIACRELEAFYLGDLLAVERGLGMGPRSIASRQNKAKFRDPDKMLQPSEELLKLTNGKYQKIAGSRAIGPHLDLDDPRSRSFRHLIMAIRKALQ